MLRPVAYGAPSDALRPIRSSGCKERDAFVGVGLAKRGYGVDDTGPFTLLMNVIAPILLGLGIFVAAYYGWWRRRDPAPQARTESSTERLYEREEQDRERKEGP